MITYVYNLICKDKLEKLIFIYTNPLDLGDTGKREGRHKEYEFKTGRAAIKCCI